MLSYCMCTASTTAMPTAYVMRSWTCSMSVQTGTVSPSIETGCVCSLEAALYQARSPSRSGPFFCSLAALLFLFSCCFMFPRLLRSLSCLFVCVACCLLFLDFRFCCFCSLRLFRAWLVACFFLFSVSVVFARSMRCGVCLRRCISAVKLF